jgi:dCMP deaminase
MINDESVLPLLVSPEPEGKEICIPSKVDSWDEYFLYLAEAVSTKSKDPKCPVGAVITTTDNIVLSTGFNGLARGVHDSEQILLNADEKLKIICHAEQNAILNAARIGGHPLEGTTIYVTKFPCLACCNSIIQAGIKRIHTHDSMFWKNDPFDADHSRKKLVLHDAHMNVDAPFHPAFNPTKQITIPKKKLPVPETTISAIERKAVNT